MRTLVIIIAHHLVIYISWNCKQILLKKRKWKLKKGPHIIFK